MTAPLLLSKRKAAKMLGIGRCTTLEQLIDEKKIRVVSMAGKIRIPLAEVERVAAEGTEPLVRGARPDRKRPADDSEAILDLEF